MVRYLKYWLTIFLGCIGLYLPAQSGQIKVFNFETNEALMANVEFVCLSGTSKNTTKLIYTNSEGLVLNPFFKDTTSVTVYVSLFVKQTFILLPRESKEVFLKFAVYNLAPVVLTLQAEPTPKEEVIQEVQVISKHALEAKGATNLKEVFATDLNFRTNNGHVNESALMLNGLSGNYIKIMIDGVPVVGRLNGNIDLSQINLSDVERIEVIEGPVAVAYGSNALGGVINIITKKTQKKKIKFSINTYSESVGQYNLGGSIGLKQKKNLFKVSLGRSFFQGFSNSKTIRLKDWKPREQYFGSFRLNKKIKKGNVIYIFDAFNELMTSRGEPSAPYYITAFDTYFRTNRLSNKILLNKKLQKKKALNLSLSHSFYQRKRNIYYVDLTTLNKVLTPNSSDQDTTVFNTMSFRGMFSGKKKKWNYTVGSELNKNFIIANRVSGKKKQIGDYAGFGSVTYKPIKNLSVQPGLRLAYNTKYKAPIVPSINVLYKKKNMDVRMSYAKGFRAPSLKELYLEFHYNSTINLWGNEGLSSESSDHLNFSVSIYDTIKKHFIRVTPSIYYTKINNLIDLVKVSNVDWKYTNVNYFITQGVSLKTQYFYKKLCINTGYTHFGYLNSMFDVEGFNNEYNYSDNFNVSINYRLADSLGLSFNIMYKYTGAIKSFYMNDDNRVTESFIDNYNTLDCSVTKKLLKKKILLTGGVKNLFDVSTVNMTGDVYGVSNSSKSNTLSVLWGRTYFISMKLSL